MGKSEDEAFVNAEISSKLKLDDEVKNKIAHEFFLAGRASLAAEIAKLKEKLDHYINENEYLTSLSGHAQDECDRLKEELSKVIEKLDEECFLHGHKLADQVNLCRELGLEMDSDLSDIRHEVFNMRNEIAKLREHRDRLVIIAREYARVNPRHDYKGVEQDPNGVHKILAAIESETSPDAVKDGATK